ncbi:MAG: D-2-hydroxyacid dehydrogenase [Clostridia bacterium]|nr:D-2-hydroxyacid dehydrogenase [Clostridia bacterium]
MSRKIVIAIAAMEESHRARIAAAAKIHGYEALFFDSDQSALPALTDAEIVFGQSAALAKNSPRLRWLCTPSAGVDQFMGEGVFASTDAVLTNSSGAYGVTIAEHVVMVTLEMLRRQMDYSAIVSRREWIRDLPVRSIKNSRITLMGTGDIGQETAARLRAFGPASLTGINRNGRNPQGLFDRILRQEEMDAALPKTDILILSLPATKETFRLLNASRLALLPDQALIVNVGRGSVIDQKALEEELRRGRLTAALDVFEQEPIPPQDSLWDCPHLLIMPHVAGNMTLPYTKERIVDLFLEDFENYCAGRPLLRRVDLTVGY